jgi:Zn-dependent protease with chaperone function
VSDLQNPTHQVDLDFASYVIERERAFAERSANGVPDYAFSLDEQLRRKIAMVRPVRDLAHAMTAIWAPETRQQYLLAGVAVGPRQYPEIHAIGETCARRLGIGVPQIFIYHAGEANGFTIATDDREPVIVLTSELVSILEPLELQFVIGHECGHIHNLHGVYNVAAEMIANPLMHTLLQQVAKAGMALKLIQTAGHLQLLANAVQGGLRLFFLHWSRCAEITCDRAGLICCGDLRAAQLALVKLITGDASRLQGFNIDEYVGQLRRSGGPAHFSELFADHPLIPRRVEALSWFATCETLYGWRPELRSTGETLSKAEVDRRCEQIVNVFAGATSHQG